jgi:polyisoprenoid-binding protein YceI
MKILVAPLLLCSLTTAAAEFHFDQTSSQLSFKGSYDGEPIDGKFEKFTGTVQLDFTKINDARFDVTIDVNSLNSDYTDRDDMLRSDAWFDVKKYPSARFISSKACTAVNSKIDGIRLSCPGNMTIHGKSKSLALNLVIDPKTQNVIGDTAIKRRDFGIGTGEWDEAGVIGEAVSVQFRLNLKAK